MSADALKAPGLGRRLASLTYESLLVAALLLAAATAFYVLAPGLIGGTLRHFFQAYLGAVLAAYFAYCWSRSGQTLPMKAWKIRVVDRHGHALSAARALGRFASASLMLGASCAGLAVMWKRPGEALGVLLMAPGLASIAWALLDRDGQFLHDRLAGTRLVTAPADNAQGAAT